MLNTCKINDRTFSFERFEQNIEKDSLGRTEKRVFLVLPCENKNDWLSGLNIIEYCADLAEITTFTVYDSEDEENTTINCLTFVNKFLSGRVSADCTEANATPDLRCNIEFIYV